MNFRAVVDTDAALLIVGGGRLEVVALGNSRDIRGRSGASALPAVHVRQSPVRLTSKNFS